MQTPSVFMDYLTVKKKIEYSGLSIFPLALVSPAFEAKELFEVIGKKGECGDGLSMIETGQVNSVRIMNRGELPALVLDGAILIGGAANRMLTASAVIRKDEIVNLPVVSVEAKRWDCKEYPTGVTQIVASDPMLTSARFAPSSLRRLRLEKSIETMKEKGISRVNQDMVWKHIIDLFEKALFDTENYDICELYGHWSHFFEEYHSHFNAADMQVGWIVFTGRDRWHLDVFYNLDVFRNIYSNLLESYAIETIMARLERAGEEEEYHWAPDLADAQDAFAKIKLIKFHELQATGRAEEEICFFASEHACGIALTEGPALMHMTVCSREIARG